jgi:ABC-type multidrug transport system ATPase subunit
MREAPNPLLQLQQARKTYVRAGSTIAALQGFTLQLVPGEVVGLLGPNGSGKTTLVKVITGLCDADSGELRWRDQPAQAAGRPGPHLADLGVLIEGRGAAYERLTALENARYFCGLRERPFDRRHFDALALLLDLPDVHAPVRQLSTGNKLRAGLLCTLIHRPALVLLDEPTLGLDLQGVERLQSLVQHAAGQGTSFLIGSHDLHFIERLCGRIVCIHAGHKRFDGSHQAFIHQSHPYQLRLQLGPHAPPPLDGSVADAPWQQHDGVALLPLRDHAQACAVLQALQADLPRYAGMELRRIELREHYLRILQAQSLDPAGDAP